MGLLTEKGVYALSGAFCRRSLPIAKWRSCIGQKNEEIAFELPTLYLEDVLLDVPFHSHHSGYVFAQALLKRTLAELKIMSAAILSDSYESYGRIVNVISWLLLCVMVLTVGTRAATKWSLIHRLEGDDLFALIAFVSPLQLGEDQSLY